ncbi:hypothetical protein HAX54_013343, partial [Datura stramonium]|nr:hypothetical protein [Datura stramonium]
MTNCKSKETIQLLEIGSSPRKQPPSSLGYLCGTDSKLNQSSCDQELVIPLYSSFYAKGT